MYPYIRYALQAALNIELIVTKVLFFKLSPFKTCISQPLWNANFIGPEGCEMQVLNGSVFTHLKRKTWVKRAGLRPAPFMPIKYRLIHLTF
jgi:hypothetical protein